MSVILILESSFDLEREVVIHSVPHSFLLLIFALDSPGVECIAYEKAVNLSQVERGFASEVGVNNNCGESDASETVDFSEVCS